MGTVALIYPDLEQALRLVAAALLGGFIGFERRWHGHAAGPHTNGLVCFGSALFVMTGGALGGDSLGRVIAQVATGVGFLAGGVILRDGLRVRGLNTAATVWCVAAIGVFVGMGQMVLAAVATLIIVAANSLFHTIEHSVPRLRRVVEIDASEEEARLTKNATPDPPEGMA
jgi:putative Mg2+ transporter-C (MgtC) family protein